jgi:hypothetical protein
LSSREGEGLVTSLEKASKLLAPMLGYTHKILRNKSKSFFQIIKLIFLHIEEWKIIVMKLIKLLFKIIFLPPLTL